MNSSSCGHGLGSANRAYFQLSTYRSELQNSGADLIQERRLDRVLVANTICLARRPTWDSVFVS